MSISITPSAIQMMIEQKELEMIVQLLNLKKMKIANRISCDLSDGIYKIKAYITDKAITQNDNHAFIKVTSYGLLSQDDRPMGVVVNACQVLDYYEDKLGIPLDFLKERTSGYKGEQPRIETSKLRSQSGLLVNQKKDEQSKSAQVEQKKFNFQNQTAKKTPSKEIKVGRVEGEVDNFEKISDLYPDFPNWQIVARLVKKSYKQFVSKSGKGKQTKVLNVEFIDSSGFKISGALFGDSAFDFHDALKQGQVYQVSKGQIREDQYNQNKGKNYSRYSIMFNRLSQFKLCVNTDMVPQNASLQDISSVSKSRRIGEQYDAVGIIISINDEVQIPKDNKTLYKQAFEICDPINEMIMDCVIWNKHAQIEQNFLNKTVGLFGFRLNQYNEKLSLNSSYQSELKILNDHPYKKYESKRFQRNKMEQLSERKERNGTIEIEQNLKDLKELESEVVYIEQGKQIKSTLTLTLTFITNKSWSYESCPFCRKSAEAFNRCASCERYIEETVPRYKLNVQLSDHCGSIWATGFEQFGLKIFADYAEGIKGIKQLQEFQRHRLFQKHLFQEFTVKIISKLDRDHQVKHTINKVYDCNILHKVQQNIKRIINKM